MISQDFTNSDRAHLVRFVRGFVSNPDTAEDIAHDALLRAQKFDSADVQNFTGWLYRIARNLCVDYYRSTERREACTDLEFVQDSRTANGDEQLYSHLHDQVRRAVADLPTPFREVIELAYYQGLSYEEIAQHQQSTVPAVKQRMFRAKEKLRKRLVN